MRQKCDRGVSSSAKFLLFFKQQTTKTQNQKPNLTKPNEFVYKYMYACLCISIIIITVMVNNFVGQKQFWRCVVTMNTEHQWCCLSNYLDGFCCVSIALHSVFCVIFCFYCCSKPLNQYFVKTAICIWSFFSVLGFPAKANPMTIVIGNQVVRFVMHPSITLCVYSVHAICWWWWCWRCVISYFYFADFDGLKFAYIEHYYYKMCYVFCWYSNISLTEQYQQKQQ